MEVNSVNNYQQYRKEYIRLSTAINRGKQKGLNIDELLTQREQLKYVYSIQQKDIVNNNESKQEYTNKSKQRKQTSNSIQSKQSKQLEIVNQSLLETFLNEVKQIKEQIIDELNEHFKELKQLQTESQLLIQSINERKTKLEKDIKNKTRSVDESKTKSVKVSTPKENFPSGMITLRFNQELGKRIKNFSNQNPQSFPSVSHFVRSALLAYQNGMEIDGQQQFSGNSTKRNLRVDKEIKEIYQNLPEGQKALTFNQILASFLATS